MTLPYNFTNILNLSTIGLALFFVLMGYKRGLLDQLLDLVGFLLSLVLAWVLAPYLADSVPLIPSNLDFFMTPLVGESLHAIANTILWFVLSVIAMSLLMNFVIKPFAKGIHAIPLANVLNRILGAIYGLIPFALLALLASLILSSPLFSNGRASVESSLLKPVLSVSDELLQSFLNQDEAGGLISKMMKGESIKAEDFDFIPNWFESFGIPEELKAPFEKLINQEALSTEDYDLIKNYMDTKQLSKDEWRTFFDGMGLTPSQIDQIFKTLNIK